MEIKIYDYEDEYWGYINCIGLGLNSESHLVPLIDRAVADDVDEITVRLNTGGGSVYSAFAIYNALIRAKEAGIKVITVNDGLCASAGTIIFMAGDERIVYTSLFMAHKPSIFVFGSMDSDFMQKQVDFLDTCQDVIETVYAPSGNDSATIKQMLDSETWLTPAMTKELGFATEDRSAQTDKKPDVLETTMQSISSPANRAYAYKVFNSIPLKNNNNMSEVKELIAAAKANTEKSGALMTFLENNIPAVANLFKPKNETEDLSPENASIQLENESYIYYEGTLEVGTAVYTDEEMTESAGDGDHTLMDGRTLTVADGKVTAIAEAVPQDVQDMEALQVENAELREAVNSLNVALTASNLAIEKLKNTKSTFKPEDRKQTFQKAKNETVVDPAKPAQSAEDREARRLEVEANKNAKKSKQ